MARFYQTPDRRMVENFVYAPPIELAMAAMGKKDEQIKTDLDTMEIMRSLPIDYWKGVDDERATQVKNEWEQKINDVATAISGDMLNPTNRARLMQLKSELNRDMTSGNIYKLQQNAAGYRDLVAKAANIKDDATRAKYLEELPKKYLQGNPEGAYSSIFKPGELYQFRDVPGEFVEWFRKQQPDTFSQVMENSNGRWVIKNSSETTQNLVKDQFKQFVGASPDVKGYLQHRQNSGIFGERYFSDNGELDMNPGTTFKAMDDYVQNESYTQTKTAKEMDPDQYGVINANLAADLKKMAQQNEYQKQAEAREAAKQRAQGKDNFSPIVASDKNIEWYYKYTKEGMQAQQELISMIRDSVKDMPANIRQAAFANPGTFFKTVLANPGNPLYDKYNRINVLYQKQAGDTKFAALGLDNKTLEAIGKKLDDKRTTNALRAAPGYLNMGQTRPQNIKPIQLSQMTGKTITYQGKQYYVKNMDLEPQSHYLDARDMHISSTVNATLIPFKQGSSMMDKEKEIQVPFDFEQPNVAEKVGITINPIISR